MKIPCIRCTSSMEGIERMAQRTEIKVDKTAYVRLPAENLNEEPGGCGLVEVSGAVQQKLRIQ